MLKKRVVVIPKRAAADLTWISKEIDTEKLKARLLIKDIGKKERRLLKRAIVRLTSSIVEILPIPEGVSVEIPIKKARKSRVKKVKVEPREDSEGEAMIQRELDNY